MFEEHLPPSQLSSGRPSNTDLFQKEVTPPRLLPKINSYADMADAHQSECVPDMHQSGGTNTVDAACEHPSWACDLTSWVPPGLVPPGLAFDDDMSVISGGEEVSSTLPARSLDGCVHGQVVSDVTLLRNDAFMQDDECAASAGSVPAYANIVSPVAQPNFASFHEPQHHLGPDLPMGRLHADMSMEASEASDRKQCCNDLLCNADKDTSWYKNYRALKEFKAEHGHTNVPQEYPRNPSLGNWVKYNRYKMREWDNSGSNDDLEKMTLLVEIGLRCYIGKGNAAKVNGNHFSQTQVETWEMQFMNLCKYKDESGNCDVPSTETGKWKSLGEWVKRQRKVYRKFHSTREVQGNKDLIERFDRLNRIGFKFRIGSGKGKSN
mmetsp:Transcript_14171/g.28916  ORF Transcript_14171/g.28916 Transcript_14171/m.28916 type:complete len:379 (+) Transcript_14171:531-1667(+)